MTIWLGDDVHIEIYYYYPPEVSSMKYCCLGELGRNTSGSSLNGGNRKHTLKYWYNWVVKKRNTTKAVLRPQYTPWLLY